MLEKLDFGDNY